MAVLFFPFPTLGLLRDSQSSEIGSLCAAMVQILMRPSIYKFEVFNRIVSYIAIFMVDLFIATQASLDMAFHNKSMGADISIFHRVRMIWHSGQIISSAGFACTTFPPWIAFSFIGSHQRFGYFIFSRLWTWSAFWPRHGNHPSDNQSIAMQALKARQ